MIGQEKLKYKCDVHVDIYEHDKLINTIDKSNLLLKTGKLIILECMCNVVANYGVLNSMAFGNSDSLATIDDDIYNFGTYHVNNTTGYVLDLVNFDNVKIYWELTESEFNGNTIKTIGLVGSNKIYNMVFNRINLDLEEYVDKKPFVKLSGYWHIYFN